VTFCGDSSSYVSFYLQHLKVRSSRGRIALDRVVVVASLNKKANPDRIPVRDMDVGRRLGIEMFKCRDLVAVFPHRMRSERWRS
jgi:hypothetical protein